MIRNSFAYQNKVLNSALVALALVDPFVKSMIGALIHTSKEATTGKQLLDSAECMKMHCSQSNVGLVLENYSSRVLYGATQGAVTDEQLAPFAQALILGLNTGTTDDPKDFGDLLFFRGNFEQPFVLDENGKDTTDGDGSMLVVQFNQTHRLVISRKVSNIDHSVDRKTGEKITRNKLGISISFIPNEYNSRYTPGEGELPTYDEYFVSTTPSVEANVVELP